MDSEITAPLFNPRAERGLCQQMKTMLLSSFVLQKVHPTKHESGQTYHRAQRGAGNEQVFASQPGPPAEQTQGGGEGVEGDLRPEGSADHGDPGAAA